MGSAFRISNWKTESIPNIVELKKSAVKEADITDTSTDTEKFLCTSSNENITPASGAWKAAARPALAPQVRRNFSSVFPLSNPRDIPFPAMAPNWIDGPSLPSASPPSIHKKPPRNFDGSTFHHTWSSFPAISPSSCGIPLPDIIDSYFKSLSTTHANRTSTISHPAIRSRFPLVNVKIFWVHCPAYPKTIR